MMTTAYVAVVVVTLFLAGWLARFGWRQRSHVTLRAFSGLAACGFLLLLTELLSLLGPTQALARFWFHARYLILEANAILWLLLALTISGRGHWITRRVRWGLVVMPLALQVLQWTSGYHQLWVLRDVIFVYDAPFWLADITTRQPSIGFLLHIFYSGALTLVGTLFLLDFMWKRRRSMLLSTFFLFGAAWSGLAFTLASAFGVVFLERFNPLPLGVALSMVLLAGAVWRAPLLHQPLEAPDLDDRMPGWLLLAFPWVLAVIGAGATYTYQDFVARFQVEVEGQLVSIAALKTAELVDWRQERFRDASMIYQNGAFIHLVRRTLASPPDITASEDLQEWLRRLQSPAEYRSIYLLDPQGTLVFAVPSTIEDAPADLVAHARALAPTSEVTFLDLHRHANENGVGDTLHFTLLIPILDVKQANTPLALLALEIDPQLTIYPRLQNWPATTTTSETFLVRREGEEVVHLSPLRAEPDATLALRVPLTETFRPAVQAALGQRGVLSGIGYQGVPTIAAVSAVPDSPWLLIARMDRAEVLAPIQNRGWQFLTVTIGLIVAAWGGFEVVRRQVRLEAHAAQLQAAEALHQSEERFQTLVEEAPTAIMILTGGRFDYANRAALALFGLDTREQLQGRPVVDYFHPAGHAQLSARIYRLNVLRRAVPTTEEKILRADGTVLDVEVSAVPFAWEEQAGALVFVHDLTARKQAEIALRNSEERYRLIFETSIDGILIGSVDGEILAANPAACRMLGRTEAELIQVGRDGIVEGADARLAFAIEERQRTGALYGEVTMRRKDGTTFPAEVSSTIYKQEVGVAYTSIILRDITARKAADAALRRSEVALQKAQEIAHVGSWTWHILANRLEWSDEMYRIFGIDRITFSGKLTDVVTSVIHPDDRAAVEASNRAVSERGMPAPLEYRVVWPDGTVRNVYAEAGELIRDAAGAPIMLTGIVQDITERKRTEEALRESEARYRGLLDTAPVGIVVHAGGKILYMNPTAAYSLGLEEPVAAVGRSLADFVHPDNLAEVLERNQKLLLGDEPAATPVEETYVRSDGTLIHAQVMASVLTYEGQPAVQAVMIDITQHKEAQAQLRLQSAALEAAANAILITDRNGLIKWANPAFTTLTGYTLAESTNYNPRELIFSGIQDDDFYAQMWETILDGHTWKGQLVNRRKDGTLYDEEMIIAPVSNNQGQINHFVAIKQDISARMQHERELTIIASVSAALRHVRTRAETISGVLEQLCRLLRVEGAALGTVDFETREMTIEMGHGLWANMGGLRVSSGPGAIASILHQRQGYLNNSIATDPRFANIDFVRGCEALAGVPLMIEERLLGLLWVGSTRPLTEHDVQLLGSIADIAATALHREALYEQLQSQARQMAQVMGTVSQGLLLLNASGEILLTNPAAAKLLPLLTHHAPGTLPKVLTHLGERPLAELLTSPPKGLRHEINAGSRIIEVLARPIPNGSLSEQWVLLLDDVTQARQAQTQMQLQERLATVGQLAAGIAHDFNNIMAVIILYAEMVARSKGLPTRERERLQTIDEQAQRATALIRQILDFSRQSMLERQPLDLLSLVKEQVKLLERTLPETIAPRLEYLPGQYTVSADPTRMQQIVMNLAINARDAMPLGGELVLGLAYVLVEKGRSPLIPEMAPGPWIRLTVRDTGTGIPPDILPHIFDPFFTTKAPGKGSGLGLAQVHGIVLQHEGRIDVATAIGQGTTITIYLPALAVSPGQPVALPAGETLRGRGERVLLVEDNIALRVAMAEMLQGLNYTVLEANNGQEALALLEREGTNIAVILSDLVMPLLGGIPLVHTLRRQGWQMPVILMTGHPMDTETENLAALGVSAYLLKPLQAQQLAVALHDALYPAIAAPVDADAPQSAPAPEG